MRFYEGPSKDGLYSLPTLVFASPVTLFVPLSFDISNYVYIYIHMYVYIYVHTVFNIMYTCIHTME